MTLILRVDQEYEVAQEDYKQQQQGVTIRQALEQVKQLKQEREKKLKPKYVSNGGVVVGKEERFKLTGTSQREKEEYPGPGHYNMTIAVREIKVAPTKPTRRTPAFRQRQISLDFGGGSNASYSPSPDKIVNEALS